MLEMPRRMADDKDSKFDVFLSHRSSDKEFVRQIAGRLEDQAQLHPFLDEWHLVPGEPLQEQLEAALQDAQACAVFVGPSGLSPWENEETRVILESRIKDHKIRVIPVLLPGAKEETIDTLPPLLKRFLWVDFRTGPTSDGPFNRLVAGILGKPPGRNSSESIAEDSLFVTKSTNELLKQFLPPHLRNIDVNTKAPLHNCAKLLHLHNPDTNFSDIERELSKARSLVYDTKYSSRSTREDERYIDFTGWQNQLRHILYEVGLRDFSRLDVVNVGIGNGNENPEFYSSFRSFTGVDISQKSLDRASKLLPFMTPLQAAAEDLRDIPTNSKDLYLSLRTYQSSFFNIVDSTFEAARVTRRRGAAVISVPNVYVDKGRVSMGLQRSSGDSLDPHFSWELAERIRRALYQAEFDASIHTGLFEVFVVGQK
jgi:hypothetical protein